MTQIKFTSPPSKAKLGILPNDHKNNISSNTIDMPLCGTVYQVDYTCVNAGKTVGASKRRIRWRFGFADQDSIDKGLLGPDCRGEEHEIILNWSLTSGKRTVLADGNEVFVECKPYETSFDYSWVMRGNRQVKISGNARPSWQKDVRQFDLWLDGLNFFQFSEIFQLGRRGTRGKMRNTVRELSVKPTINETSRHMDASTRQRSFGIRESEKVDWPQHTFHPQPQNPTPTTIDTQQSFDFAGDSTIASESIGFAASPTRDFLSAPPPPTFEQVMEANTSFLPMTASASVAHTQSAALTVNDEEYAKQHRHNIMSYQVMQAYQHAPNVVAPPTAAPLAAPVAQEPDKSYDETITPPGSPQPTSDTNIPVFEGEETYIAPRMSQEDKEPSQHDISKMLNKLCNLDDITSDPLQDSKLTFNPFNNDKNKKSSKTKQNKSTPIAPTSPIVYGNGPQPSLNEIKVIRKSSSSMSPDKEIMKTDYAQVAAQGPAPTAGSLVVYGQTPGQLNMHAAPPLQRPVGFGVGAQIGQGYGNYTTQTQNMPHSPPQQQGVYANM